MDHLRSTSVPIDDFALSHHEFFIIDIMLAKIIGSSHVKAQRPRRALGRAPRPEPQPRREPRSRSMSNATEASTRGQPLLQLDPATPDARPWLSTRRRPSPSSPSEATAPLLLNGRDGLPRLITARDLDGHSAQPGGDRHRPGQDDQRRARGSLKDHRAVSAFQDLSTAHEQPAAIHA